MYFDVEEKGSVIVPDNMSDLRRKPIYLTAWLCGLFNRENVLNQIVLLERKSNQRMCNFLVHVIDLVCVLSLQSVITFYHMDQSLKSTILFLFTCDFTEKKEVFQLHKMINGFRN